MRQVQAVQASRLHDGNKSVLFIVWDSGKWYDSSMIGDRLGKWVIFKELGRGGMGRVYLAQEELTGKQAALKVLAAELAQEVGFLQRFHREIETLAKLDHPNIVRFFESGYENGHYFYAMEYVEGLSL